MRKFLIASVLGILFGAIVTPHLAGPLLAQETDQAKTYQQLELFGDLFDRIRAEYVEEGVPLTSDCVASLHRVLHREPE